MSAKTVKVGPVEFANDKPFALIAGPCAMESRDHALEMAEALTGICADLGIGFIYKSSYDKANRTSVGSGRGVGMEKGLPILAEVRENPSNARRSANMSTSFRSRPSSAVRRTCCSRQPRPARP